MYGANVRLDADSMIGSFGVYKKIFELCKSLHLNYEQHTVTSQSSQFLTNIDDLIGPM